MPSILALLQTDMLCYNEVKELDKKAKVQKIAASLNVIDDALFQKMAEDAGFCEEFISAVLKQKVMVKSVTPQNSIKNLQGRSVVLDALCILEDDAVVMWKYRKQMTIIMKSESVIIHHV